MIQFDAEKFVTRIFDPVKRLIPVGTVAASPLLELINEATRLLDQASREGSTAQTTDAAREAFERWTFLVLSGAELDRPLGRLGRDQLVAALDTARCAVVFAADAFEVRP